MPASTTFSTVRRRMTRIFVQYPYYQTGYDTSLYNYIGRYAQIGATYKF